METEELIIALGTLTLITITFVVVVWQGASIIRARLQISREDAYRRLAEDADVREHDFEEWQKRVDERLSEIGAHLERIEATLRERV